MQVLHSPRATRGLRRRALKGCPVVLKRSLGLVAAFAAAGAASAQTVTGTTTVGGSVAFTSTNFTSSIVVPKFDNPLLHLDSVEIKFHGVDKGSVRLENQSVVAEPYSVNIGYSLLLGNGSGGSLLLLRPQAYAKSGTLPAFDGVLDFGGASGFSVLNLLSEDNGVATLTADADTAPFTGAGSITLPVVAVADAKIDASANVAKSVRNQAAADVTIVYHYSYTPASVGDKVFLDANNDGVQQPNEKGVPGVAVHLLDKDGNVVGNTTTDANGIYGFSGLIPGDYAVKFDAPAGAAFTTQGQGGNPALDSDANSNGNTASFTLHSGDAKTDVDAGLVGLQSLGDRVFLDMNANGLQDAGEPGIPNVPVKLYDAQGNVIGSTVTDVNGIYAFTGLLTGTYTVGFEAPNGYDYTTKGTGTATDSDANTDGKTDVIALTAGQNRTDIDAGLVGNLSLGDRVFLDANSNGLQDTGEHGIPNVTVQLLNASGAVIDTDVTDSEGGYLFTGLTPGQYRVKVVAPSGYAFTTKSAGTDATIDSNVDGAGLTDIINLSGNDLTIDAGLYGSLSLGDRVWRDDNRNGLQDTAEPGIPGVTVKLLDASNSVIATTTTGVNGIYKFTNLAPGDYTVAFEAPTGYGFTKQFADAQKTALDSNANPSSGKAIVSLTRDDITIDAGLVGALKIGDTVWLDSDGDGVFEPEIGEIGLANVTLTLYGDTDGDGKVDVTATTKTDATGKYLFNSLAPGRYAVYVNAANLPSGAIATYDLDGTGTLNVALGNLSGTDNLCFDFGYRLKAYTGVGTPGYWKNHPSAWPVDSIIVGGMTYTKSQAIAIIGNSTTGDYTYIMYRAVACAKLNIAAGNPASMTVKVGTVYYKVEDLIRIGDAWLAQYPVGSRPSSTAWNTVSAIATAIDDYNNGRLGVPHR